MADSLEKKARQRTFKKAIIIKDKTKKHKPMKLIIGDPMPSTSSFVKEQTIKLKNVGERGTGPGSQAGAGVTIHSRPSPQQRRSTSAIGQMGGRHRR